MGVRGPGKRPVAAAVSAEEALVSEGRADLDELCPRADVRDDSLNRLPENLHAASWEAVDGGGGGGSSSSSSR
eukprot:768508-Hanusia_phi.AAC.2